MKIQLPFSAALKMCAAALIAICVNCVAAHAASDPIVQISSGRIQGRLIQGGGATFKGIPYAQAPVGDLRWRDPLPMTPWTGVRDAGKFEPACRQEKSEYYPDAGAASKEDCLYLNLWTPEWPAKTPKAVMVWLYGGANSVGSASLDFYDGTRLSRRDVLVVTINFRLGVFGFLAHPGLTAESTHHSSGNYGILDQLAALKWVHDNISKFGGDPKRVTLFGQSSGGMDTSYLIASPLSRGLIQRGIQESGPPVRVYETLADAERQGIDFAESMKAPANPAEAVKFLRSIPGPELEKAVEKANPDAANTAATTEIDGYTITRYVALAYRDGQDLPIPMIIGNNLQEQTHNYKPEVMRRWIKSNFGSLAPKAEEFYGWGEGGIGKDDPFFGSSGVQITADTRQRCPAIAEGIWREAHNHPTYEYMFDVPIAGERATRHSAEIPFVFGNLLAKGPMGGPFTSADKTISDQLQEFWTNFAKTGNPNAKGLPLWPEFNADARSYMEFTVHDGPVVKQNLRRTICDIYIDALKETIPGNTAAAYPQ